MWIYQTQNIRDLTKIDICDPNNLNPSTMDRIKDAFYENGYVVLKKQCAQHNYTITAPIFENIARQFDREPMLYGISLPENKYITRLTNNGTKSARTTGSGGWHIDGTMHKMPNEFCLMYVQHAPNPGSGGTQLVHSPPFLDRIQSDQPDLYALWNRLFFFTRGFTVHPVIAQHPITNRHYMAIHTAFTQQFIEVLDSTKMKEVHNALNGRYFYSGDMMLKVAGYEKAGIIRLHSQSSTKTMLERIRKEIEESEFRHVTEYENGDLLIRDNLALLHIADPSARRTVEEIGYRNIWRVALEGTHIPTKYSE